MKKPFKIALYSMFLGLACLCQGCSDDLKTAFWWMPSPYMPVQFVTTTTDAGSSGGGSGVAVGGGN